MPNLTGYAKATMRFTKDTITWSESHTYATAGVDLKNPTLLTDLTNLCNARAFCLGGDVQFKAAIVSQEGINRDVNFLQPMQLPQRAALGYYAGGPIYPATDANWAYQTPQVSWPLKLLDSTNNEICISYIAGMPSSLFQKGPGPYDINGGIAIPGAYLSAYGTYLITGSKWGAAARTWPSGVFKAANSSAMGPGLPTYAAAAGTTPAQLAITLPATILAASAADGTPALTAPVVGMWIRVGGWKYSTPQERLRLNGTYQLVSTSGGGVWVINVPRLRANPGITTPGYVQGAAYFFSPYANFAVDNLTHRKRGVTTGGPRGRQS